MRPSAVPAGSGAASPGNASYDHQRRPGEEVRKEEGRKMMQERSKEGREGGRKREEITVKLSVT